MAEPAPLRSGAAPPSQPARRAGADATKLAWIGAAAAFAALLGALGWQLAAGADPAIGTPQPTAPAVEPARRVLVRRIERTIVITRGRPAPGGAAAASAPATSAPAAAAPTPAGAPTAVTRAS